jgi:NitT/TauT family transport system ATP-binding protein
VINNQQSAPKILIENISLSFGAGTTALRVLDNINLSIAEGEIVTFIGPSGSGKSTMLNLISDTLNIGQAQREGKIGINWVSETRNRLGYIFQKDTLLPWRTLVRNVEVGLEIIGMPPDQRRALAHDWIERLGLQTFEQSYPHMLSGGMRQRANIIRTLICDPEIVLMDEPFGALDAQTRMALQQMLIDLWQSSKPTICFVTHDLEESILLGNRVVLLSARPGRIQAIYEVETPHPRDIVEFKTSQVFQQLYQQIWSDLKSSLPNHLLRRKYGV